MDLENLCRWILAGLGIGIGMPSPASAQEANSLLQLPPPIVEFLQESWDKDGLHQLDVGKDGHVDYVLKVKDPQKGTFRVLCTYDPKKGPAVSPNPGPITYRDMHRCAEAGLRSKVMTLAVDAEPESIVRYEQDNQGRITGIESEGKVMSGGRTRSLTQMQYHNNGEILKREHYQVNKGGGRTLTMVEEWDSTDRSTKVLRYSNGVLSTGEIITYSSNNSKTVDRYENTYPEHCEISHTENPEGGTYSPTKGFIDRGCDGKPDKCWDLESGGKLRECLPTDMIQSPFLEGEL